MNRTTTPRHLTCALLALTLACAVGCETKSYKTEFRDGKLQRLEVDNPTPPPSRRQTSEQPKLPDPAPASRALMDRYTTQLNDLGKVLRSVKDPATARAALPDVQTRVTALRESANRIESLSEEQRVLLGTKYSNGLNTALSDFDRSTQTIRDNPQLRSILDPALSRLPALGFR